MAIEELLDPPLSDEAAALADWLEIYLLVQEEEELSRARIRDLLADEPLAEADPSEDLDEPELTEIASGDERIDHLLAEIERRRSAAPNVYPFVHEEQVVARQNVVGGSAYDLLLLLSLHDGPYRASYERRDAIERPFDELVRVALVAYMGPGAEGVLFAQKFADDTDDAVRPRSFPDAIRWLRVKLGTPPDSRGLPPDGAPEPEEIEPFLPARTYNDGGVDVITWRPFLRDERAGYPVLLAQCTTEISWRRKTRDVSLSLWRSWVDFAGHVNKVLVIPFAVPANKWWWHDRNLLAGMIVDRTRLAHALSCANDDELMGVIGLDAADWIAAELAAIRERV